MKSMKIKFAIAIGSLLFTIQNAQALDANSYSIVQACESGQCPNGITVKNWSNSKLDQNQVDKHPYFKELTKMAKQLAVVWADTILEGEYASISETALFQIDEYIQNGKVVFYFIGYAEDAVEFNGPKCIPNRYKNKYKGIDCTFGSIAEKAVVSSDFQDSFVPEDEEAYFSN